MRVQFFPKQPMSSKFPATITALPHAPARSPRNLGNYGNCPLNLDDIGILGARRAIALASRPVQQPIVE